MTSGGQLFRLGAFIALGLLVVHATRTKGARGGAALVGFFLAWAALREWGVRLLSRYDADAPPYFPSQSMGQIGAVNMVVVAGWVFTLLLSYAVATMIQRTSFPETSAFLTLALAALVSTTIGYAVEVTGIRLNLWRWTNPTATRWLPFECPSDMFDAWGTTAFVILLMFLGLRDRLLGATRLRSAAATAAVLVVFAAAVLAQHAYRVEPPHQKLMIALVSLASVLGFTSPRAWGAARGRGGE